MRRAGRIIPRNTILDSVWNSSDDIKDNSLYVYISKLRNKVDDGHKVKLIHTVKGLGYGVRDGAKAGG